MFIFKYFSFVSFLQKATEDYVYKKIDTPKTTNMEEEEEEEEDEEEEEQADGEAGEEGEEEEEEDAEEKAEAETADAKGDLGKNWTKGDSHSVFAVPLRLLKAPVL